MHTTRVTLYDWFCAKNNIYYFPQHQITVETITKVESYTLYISMLQNCVRNSMYYINIHLETGKKHDKYKLCCSGMVAVCRESTHIAVCIVVATKQMSKNNTNKYISIQGHRRH